MLFLRDLAFHCSYFATTVSALSLYTSRSFDLVKSIRSVQTTQYNMSYSNAWVLDGVSYYFHEPYSGLQAARQAVKDGRNISAVEFYGKQGLAKRGISGLIEGAGANLYNNPGLLDQFFQWFKNVYNMATGDLWQAPGGCWWYHASGNLAVQEKNCIGSLSNDEVISGDRNDLISCPPSGYSCYKYHVIIDEPREYEEFDGTIWCVSPDKSQAQANGGQCANFGIQWTGDLNCLDNRQ